MRLGRSDGDFVALGLEGVMATKLVAIASRFVRTAARACLATTLLALPIFVTALAACLGGSAPA
jgi:hypothetical protein